MSEALNAMDRMGTASLTEKALYAGLRQRRVRHSTLLHILRYRHLERIGVPIMLLSSRRVVVTEYEWPRSRSRGHGQKRHHQIRRVSSGDQSALFLFV